MIFKYNDVKYFTNYLKINLKIFFNQDNMILLTSREILCNNKHKKVWTLKMQTINLNCVL